MIVPEPRCIIETAERLGKRVGERCPASSLYKLAGTVTAAVRAAGRRTARNCILWQ